MARTASTLRPVVLPIPGTKSFDHLVDNLGATAIVLTEDQVATLDALE